MIALGCSSAFALQLEHQRKVERRITTYCWGNQSKRVCTHMNETISRYVRPHKQSFDVQIEILFIQTLLQRQSRDNFTRLRKSWTSRAEEEPRDLRLSNSTPRQRTRGNKRIIASYCQVIKFMMKEKSLPGLMHNIPDSRCLMDFVITKNSQVSFQTSLTFLKTNFENHSNKV